MGQTDRHTDRQTDKGYLQCIEILSDLITIDIDKQHPLNCRQIRYNVKGILWGCECSSRGLIEYSGVVVLLLSANFR